MGLPTLFISRKDLVVLKCESIDFPRDEQRSVQGCAARRAGDSCYATLLARGTKGVLCQELERGVCEAHFCSVPWAHVS